MAMSREQMRNKSEELTRRMAETTRLIDDGHIVDEQGLRDHLSNILEEVIDGPQDGDVDPNE